MIGDDLSRVGTISVQLDHKEWFGGHAAENLEYSIQGVLTIVVDPCASLSYNLSIKTRVICWHTPAHAGYFPSSLYYPC
jgi:hypothetical protein